MLTFSALAIRSIVHSRPGAHGDLLHPPLCHVARQAVGSGHARGEPVEVDRIGGRPATVAERFGEPHDAPHVGDAVARMRAAAVAHRSFNGSSLGLFRPRATPRQPERARRGEEWACRGNHFRLAGVFSNTAPPAGRALAADR